MKKVSIKLVKEVELDYGIDSVVSPVDVSKVLHKYIGDSDREMLVVICLDVKNNINSINTVSVGILNYSLSHPREVFKAAILSNSAAIILGHNHPSGDTQPSFDDIKVTERMEKAGDILGIELLDHVIIGGDSFYSLKDGKDI